MVTAQDSKLEPNPRSQLLVGSAFGPFPMASPPSACTYNTNLESQWLIIMGYFKPRMVYFGV